MPSPIELLAAACLVLGTFLMVVTALGLLRLPDVFCRMHAAGKAGTLGVVLIILGAVIALAGTANDVSIRGLLPWCSSSHHARGHPSPGPSCLCLRLPAIGAHGSRRTAALPSRLIVFT
jgi:hypothetical protein